MSDPSPPNPPPLPAAQPPEPSKKKSRLQWDEDNLISNAQEMERAGPRMKIDEPKTPYLQGSETCSSTSGSARTSPPESPSFIPGERLVGFRTLEASISRPPPSSDGASSAGSAGRSVHICEEVAASSTGSSPKSREVFAARRKAHYRNEFRSVRELLARDNHHQQPPNDRPQPDDDDDEHRGGTVRDVAYALRSAVPNGHHAINGNGHAHSAEHSHDSEHDEEMPPVPLPATETLNGHGASAGGGTGTVGSGARGIEANGDGAHAASRASRTPGSDVAGD